MVLLHHHVASDSPDENTLIVPVSLHVRVGVIADGKDVRGQLAHLLVSVLLYLLAGVDG